jgi:hypothetical protein
VLTLCRTRLHDVAGAMLARAQEAGAARADLDLTTFQRMIYGIALACEQNPDLAPGMLRVVKDGVLTPVG